MGEALAGQLRVTWRFFKKTLRDFSEEEAGYAPVEGMFSVAAQVGHVAGTVEWFVEGAFGEGFDMDFAGHLEESRSVTTLAAAVAWLDRAFERAVEVVGSASDADLLTPIDDPRMFTGQPRSSIVGGIVDHTAHHRGALTVYVRMLGREPGMPYA